MKTHPPTAPRINPHNETGEADSTDDKYLGWRRQWLTILFAIILASIAHLAAAQNPTSTIHYGAVADVPLSPHPGAVVDPAHITGGTVPHCPDADTRPVYVEMTAQLANFDADADPDGWRAEIVLRDRLDQPTTVRSYATFDLMPKISTATGDPYVNAQHAPIRWSMPLEFDPHGTASVKLPLRHSLRPMFGWSTAAFPQSGIRSHNDRIDRRQIRNYSRTRSFVTIDMSQSIGMPNEGELRVRVSVPTEGVFETAVPVKIRPAVLVDTRWPYR